MYGNSLIGEESNNIFKTYHFDYRGSTVAITDSTGTVIDTFAYDSYGNVISRTGTTDAIFLYNGEYGVITDSNGLLYMRARYYDPELRRFVNADILMGDINNSTTLNCYAYANGNPISNIDPFGLAADEGRGGGHNDIIIKALQKTQENLKSYYRLNSDINGYNVTFNDALSKIINSLSNGNELEDFADGIKVQIKINSNYNTSSDELITEMSGFIPVLGELMALVNFVSDEDKDYWNLIDAVISAATEKDMSKILPYTDKLSIIGNIVDVIGVINLGETIINWNSKAKVSTEISVFIQKNNGSSYMYQAIVNNKMKFKEMYSGFTGSVIKSSDERYNVLYK